MDQMARLFDMLDKQNIAMAEQGKCLARIQQSQDDTHERLFGGNGIVGHLPYLHTEVAAHGRQLTFYKGGLAILSFLWAAALAVAGAVFKRH